MPTSDEILEKFKKAHAAGDEAAMSTLKQLYNKQKAFEESQQVAAPPAQAEGAPTPQKSTPGRSMESRAAEVGGAATGGAIVGAFAPEIMGGIGTGLELVSPLTGPAAPFVAGAGAALQTGGAALKSARIASTVTGAVSSAISNVAGQTAEAAGAGPKTRFGVEVVAGMGVPAAAATAKFVVGTPAKAAWGLVQRLAGEVAPESVPKAVRQAQALLKAPGVATQPQLALHEILAKGTAADIAAADMAAKDLVAQAHLKASKLAQSDPAAAKKVVAEAEAEGKRLQATARAREQALSQAAGVDFAKAVRVKALADRELRSVGQPRELSDIGNELRAKVTGEQARALAQRSEQYKQLKAARDAEVAAKEQAGIHIDQMPAMIELKQELAKKLLLTKGGREAAGGLAQVTEQGVTNAYQRVWDAIRNKRVQVGVDENGLPKFETFKTSFEALDHVRRKLGDVVAQKDVEGYSALGQDLAREMYARISKVQEEFAGPIQRQLQSQYAGSTEELQKFGAAAGKKLTAVDRSDPDAFLRDPASLPGNYFRSQQGVRDLIELTGDKALVGRAAQDYVARQLEGKSAKQIADWARQPQQTDWMREIPGLQAKVNAYAQRVAQIERVSGKLETRAGERLQAGSKGMEAAAKEADRLLMQAREEASLRVASRVEEREALVGAATKEGQAIRDAAVSKAKAIVKDGFPAEATRKLLLQGSPEELRMATRYIAGSPGGQKALEGSVRNVLATVPSGKLAQVWEERMVPVLQESGLLGKAELAKLQADVARVIAAHEGKQGVRIVHRMVANALAQAGGEVGGRGTAGVDAMMRE